MRKLAVLFVVMCACGPDAGTHEDAGVDGHPMADAMVDAPPQCVGLDDGIDCTVDTCDMATGQVTHTPTNAMCNDNVACTTDTCSATSGCVYTPENTACDDGVACTVDACDATNGCLHTTMDSLCETDGKSCTVAHCDAAAGCSEVPTNAMCDDSATCSTDVCDPNANGADATTGCAYTLDNAMCADTAECSTDACSPGTAGADTTTGCLYTANSSACDPNATCTAGTFDCACNAGYMGDGLTCAAVTCDALTAPTNGSVSVNNGGLYPSTATYACDAGYSITPNATRTCGTDGHWSGAAPTCVLTTIFVVRVGDGAAGLSNAATALFVEERNPSDGSLVRTITIPATGATALTQSGTATAEGWINRSIDGRYVVFAGYAADAGTAGIAATTNLSADTTPVNRGVGRIDMTGAVDTSTRLVDAFSAGNPRGVASVDGSAFWVTGTSSGATAGLFYVTFGSTGAATRLDTPSVTDAVIADGQLYEATTQAVNAVGTGLPTSAPVTDTAIATVGSVRSFAFVDTDATAGVDTLYLAIDGNAATAGNVNIQKWKLDTTTSTWTKDAAFAPQLTGLTTSGSGTRGLTAWLDGGHVHVIATLAVASANRLISFVDDSETPAVSVIATAAANTVFRGIALSPNVAP
jgi:hypothetical protein